MPMTRALLSTVAVALCRAASLRAVERGSQVARNAAARPCPFRRGINDSSIGLGASRRLRVFARDHFN